MGAAGSQKLVEHGGEDRGTADLALERRLQLAADLPRDVVNGPRGDGVKSRRNFP